MNVLMYHISYCWVAVQATLEYCPRIAGQVDHIVIAAFTQLQATKISPQPLELHVFGICFRVKTAENGSGI